MQNKIIDSKNFRRIEGNSYGVGGILGGNDSMNLGVSGCNSTAELSDDSITAGTGAIGGIVGYSYGNITIENCLNCFPIQCYNGETVAGGILGTIINRNKTAVIANVYMCKNANRDTPTIRGGTAAGIVGTVGEYASVNIEGCYNTAYVMAQKDGAYNDAVGILGPINGNSYTRVNIIGCINVGQIVGNNYSGAIYSIRKWVYSGTNTIQNNYYLQGSNSTGTGGTAKSMADINQLYKTLPQYYKYGENEIKLQWET